MGDAPTNGSTGAARRLASIEEDVCGLLDALACAAIAHSWPISSLATPVTPEGRSTVNSERMLRSTLVAHGARTEGYKQTHATVVFRAMLDLLHGLGNFAPLDVLGLLLALYGAEVSEGDRLSMDELNEKVAELQTLEEKKAASAGKTAPVVSHAEDPGHAPVSKVGSTATLP